MKSGVNVLDILMVLRSKKDATSVSQFSLFEGS